MQEAVLLGWWSLSKRRRQAASWWGRCQVQVPECHAEGLRGQGRGALSDGRGLHSRSLLAGVHGEDAFGLELALWPYLRVLGAEFEKCV